MKSLINGTLILLALYAQACSAESNSSFLLLNSQSQLAHGTISSIQPTWYTSAAHANYGVIVYSRLNRSLNTNHNGTIQTHYGQVFGLGLHQQLTPWMYGQLSLQTQRDNEIHDGLNTLALSLNARF